MALSEKTCPRDGIPTQLSCAQCGEPICPSCLVRTPVGLKCPDCAGGRVGAPKRRLPIIAVVGALAVALLAVVGLSLVTSSGDDSAGDRAPPDVVTDAEVIGLNQEVAVGPYVVTVSRFNCPGKEIGTPPVTRVATGRFCVVYMTLRNAGTQPEVFTAASQLLSDGARRFAPVGPTRGAEPPTTVVLEGGVRETLGARLNPEQSLPAALVFDLPDGVTPTQLLLRFTPRTPIVRVRLDG